ncbi:immunity protein, partial [Pseudomonas syringae]
MTHIRDIIINETVADVLAVLALTTSQPRIDRLYTTYKFEALQSGELWGTYTRLFREGILALDANGRTSKGPSW